MHSPPLHVRGKDQLSDILPVKSYETHRIIFTVLDPAAHEMPDKSLKSYDLIRRLKCVPKWHVQLR